MFRARLVLNLDNMQAEQLDARIPHGPWRFASHREIVSAVTSRPMFDIICKDGMLLFPIFVNLASSLHIISSSIFRHHNFHW